MKRYEVHFLKTDNLSSDEMRCIRKGAKGIWLYGGAFEAKNGHAACAMLRKEGYSKYKLRSRRIFDVSF